MFIIKASHSETYIRLRVLIRQHCSSQRRVGFYAELLGLGIQKLNNLIMEECGLTVHALITACILQEAKRQLAYTGDHIKAITYDLNFSDFASSVSF